MEPEPEAISQFLDDGGPDGPVGDGSAPATNERVAERLVAVETKYLAADNVAQLKAAGAELVALLRELITH